MVRISVLGDALKTILNAERAGKRQVLIRPSSKTVLRFLRLMQKRNLYIVKFLQKKYNLIIYYFLYIL